MRTGTWQRKLVAVAGRILMSDKRRRMADTSRPQHRFHVAPDKFNVRAVDIRLYFLPTEKEDEIPDSKQKDRSRIKP